MFTSSGPLRSTFESSADSRFTWHCAPAQWSFDAGAAELIISPDSETDFWQRTHYGFRADNGHFLWTPVLGDLQMAVEVHMTPLHQYDQAGLMVRYSEDCWLKTSVEYELGSPSRLGCVVTNRGFSDWSTQDVPANFTKFSLRVTRHGSDFLVEARQPEQPWTQLRVAHLDSTAETGSLQCGMYACSPKHSGFTATFRKFTLDRRGPGAAC